MQLQLYRYFHTLEFTVTHTSVLSLNMSYPGNGFITVLLSLQHIMKSSLYSLIPFLPLFRQLPIPGTPSILWCNCQLRNPIKFFAATANSGTRLSSNSSCVRSSLYSLGTASTENTAPLLLHVDSLLQRHVYRTAA
jgi:hypothetical protein